MICSFILAFQIIEVVITYNNEVFFPHKNNVSMCVLIPSRRTTFYLNIIQISNTLLTIMLLRGHYLRK